MATWALSLANRSSRHPEANPVPADSHIVLIAILSGETGVAIRSGPFRQAALSRSTSRVR